MGTPYNKLYQILILTCILLFINQVPKMDVTSASSLVFAPQDDEDLVSFACKHTLYQDICISSLRSDPRSNACLDLKGLAMIALDLSITQAKETQFHIKKLIKSCESSNNNDLTLSSLNDCQEEYAEAVDDLREAAQALRGGRDYDSVNELVSGAMTDCQTCLDESVERGSSGSKAEMGSFVDKNQYFYKLCSNVLAIVKLLG